MPPLLVGARLVGAVLLAITLTHRDGSKSRTPVVAGTATTSAPTHASTRPRSAAASTTRPTPSTSSPGQAATATTPGQLAQAITDYYGLVPRNLQQAWTRLTPAYQNSHAGGFSGYQQFWSAVKRVSVSNADGQLPNSVQATITYFYMDHRVVVERTAYQLASSGGQWKIDNSTVLSSQSG